jgi:CheY-like chemotaxis protein
MARVLVVDDDPDLLDAIADAIRDAGHEVGTAANGQQALEALRGHLFQLVLLDIMMPVMDGLRFRAEQLKDPAIAGIPVVVISAASPIPKIDAAAILAKPLDLGVLLATVERHAA